MKYDVEIEAFGGEASARVCTCEGEKAAILVAQSLDRGGCFKGEEFLSGANIVWRLRVIEYNDQGHCDVIWYGQKGA